MMRSRRWILRSLALASACALALAGVLTACFSLDIDRGFGCPDGTVPCGNGCRPAKDTVCCDDGTRHTSSYCTNSAGGGCFPNDDSRDCQAGFPLGARAEFCCAANGTFGSNDCPAGQHHCGLLCQPLDVPCCEGEACTSFSTLSTCSWEANPCAYCPSRGYCVSCPADFCCADDTCAGEGRCVASTVCVGVGGSGDGSCISDADCSGTAICVSSRSCIRSIFEETCECEGSTEGTCADFVAHGIDVTACGECSASFTACCPGTMCVNGSCQSSCP
ncbi:MAG: hypothetical protein JXR96_20110 [Deltaproteobacteria bacterium]|nr:hypothetical protein [Deltaproteobacteria bacterium]